MSKLRTQFITLVKAGIASKPNVFAHIAGLVFEAYKDPVFFDYLDEEGFEALLNIEPPCGKIEYDNFMERQIKPTSCRKLKIYQFQAEILNLIFECPELIHRVEVEFGFNLF